MRCKRISPCEILLQRILKNYFRLMNFVQIGYTQKTHGVEGELRIHVEEEYIEDFLNAGALFIEVGGQKVPYFIEYIRGAGDDICKLEEIATREEAQKVASKPIFLREEDLIPENDRPNTPYAPEYEFLEGFDAADEALGALGAIIRVDEYPHQEMAVVQYNGREVLIPLHKSFILSIDKENKKVVFQLPEGLTNL